ncbi:MAG: ABC transporter ATP-binding protein [Fervidobacterium pennivorans]|uniref:Spermidine/putrescine import ATP-binding protein PotA n=3 Tax=Fervidobacterium TaxID=2422 RepID=A0A7C4VSQ1_9BACT|nr:MULTISPECIES: ABC transporter ATP-binding protein [Fervidobacterium]AMW32021.1 ABC transporter ATP-binding protein [Fervidobacterium islandicum]MDM7320752.1 ABC transporter ATP-binding protein [Fervidobacterium sp.]NPU88360.1 ABC transporter ATP-binding protein [Fervidobacterium sp.]QAV33804.1 polyamine ABC transporter ATP-binding protein [Fervidobacterium changbaicum]SDH67422.1 iron(III) transport system ATP-binding protein [Fervidobacterium changbaicum]
MSLELKGLTKVFRNYGTETVAVEAFDLRVEKGQFVTLLGPSGCGKTTTLRMIAGFEIPTSGKIILDGADVTNEPPNKRNISMVFQSYALFPHMTVEENIAFGLRIKKLPNFEVKQKVKWIMEIVGLIGLEKRRPEQLSGGQQQRVALARSLVVEPSVLLLDEPLSNLDAKLREQMRIEIKRIQKELDITTVYVTHDQIEAMSMSDLVVVMNGGRIMQIGNPFEIYSKPKNEFVADFIGKVNLFDGSVDNANNEIADIFCSVFENKRISVPNIFSLTPGQKVKIVLRPEAFKLVPFQDEERINLIRGKIISSIFVGAAVECEMVASDGTVFKTTISNPVESGIPQPGSELKLYFSNKSLWVIPEAN